MENYSKGGTFWYLRVTWNWCWNEKRTSLYLPRSWKENHGASVTSSLKVGAGDQNEAKNCQTNLLQATTYSREVSVADKFDCELCLHCLNQQEGLPAPNGCIRPVLGYGILMEWLPTVYSRLKYYTVIKLTHKISYPRYLIMLNLHHFAVSIGT